jgi:integrase
MKCYDENVAFSKSMNKIKGLWLRPYANSPGIYWYSKQINGKRTQVSLETSDLNEAILKISAIEASDVLADGSHVEFAVKEYAAFCKSSGNWTAASLDAKIPVLRAWAKWTGRLEPSKITTDKIRAYYEERCKKVARSTAYGNLMTIQGFFNWCKDVKRTCASNPVLALTEKRSTQKIKAPKPGVRKRFCTRELRDRLISECPREELKYILFCGFHAGLRFNEIVESKPEWFDLKAGLLHLQKHAGFDFKDSEERTIPLTRKFREFMETYELHEPYMIAPKVKKGRSLYRYNFKRPFMTYMKAQGCPWVTPHVMRHTFASLLASASVSIYKIAQWMGDDVKVVERHYAKLLPNDSEIDRGEI